MFINPQILSFLKLDFKIKPLFTFNGINAASGIVYDKNNVYVVSDNSNFLYRYNLISKKSVKIPLNNSAQENIEKKLKPDFECISLYRNKLWLIGSGSNSNREKWLVFDINKEKITEKNQSKFYKKLREISNLNDDELNIEGIIFTHKYILLFQRGNGLNQRNGIFVSDKKQGNINYFSIELPTINNIKTTFTDAILINNYIYFLASAEKTSSTYLDGEICGSILGIMCATSFEIKHTFLLSNHSKFEGIAYYKKNKTKLEFLLCEDKDSEETNSVIFKLSLDKNKLKQNFAY